jgi:hypothetical protein
VVAWDALWKLEREKSLSTYAAAKELGAEVVFVFNGLEAESVTAAASKLTKHEYFTSDERGRRGEALELDEGTRSAFLKYTLDAAKKSIPAESVILHSARLDSTAVVTLTGESIWFYRRAATAPTQAKQGLKLLFGRVEGGGWTPATPLTEAGNAVEDGATSGPADGKSDAALVELVRASAEHFVRAWKSGKLDVSEAEGDR